MRIVIALLGLFWFAPMLSAAPARADSFSPAQRQEIIGILRQALRTDPSLMRDAMAAVQADEAKRQDKVMRDVLTMIGPRIVDVADPVAGNPFGDVTVVYFYDTRCPYCRRMMPVMADLLRTDPMVRLVIKDIPILGPGSELESRALLASQRQGGYFKLQDLLMRNASASTRDTLRADGDRLGLDGGMLVRDMDDNLIKARLKANIDLAREIGIDGTPAIVIGQRMIAGETGLKELQQAVAEARKK
jgi:protein-disulfide isomerase